MYIRNIHTEFYTSSTEQKNTTMNIDVTGERIMEGKRREVKV